MTSTFRLYGRLIVSGSLRAVTGLHIGGTEGGFSIGKKDKPVIINPVNGQPYIPGSSLRGKMRSLTEKYMGKVTGQDIAGGTIHSCSDPLCAICHIYGRSADEVNTPTRLIVRDVPLRPDSAEQLLRAKTELPYTEIKTEVSIDRVTSQANPRQLERVAAGAVFGPLELVFSFYDPYDTHYLETLLDGMTLLEDDYLGGHGSRGSGKVAFVNLELALKRSRDEIRSLRPAGSQEPYPTLADLVRDVARLSEEANQFLFAG